MKKKEMKEMIKDLQARNEFLRNLCEVYTAEMETQRAFIKKSQLRYEEYCRYQMNEFKKYNEVEA